MPVPVVAIAVWSLVRALVGRLLAKAVTIKGLAWLVGSAAVSGWSLGNPDEYQEAKKDFYELVVSLFANVAGVNLSLSDPFSDASICNAIGEKTGMALRTVKNRESIRVDVERWALAMLEEKTGLHIKNVRDKAGVVKDVMRFASPVVADATGIPLRDISDAEKTKSDIKNYLEDRALVVLSHDVERVKVLANAALESVGSGLEALAEKIMKKGGIDPVTGRPNVAVIAELVALGLLARALIDADKRRRAEEVEEQKGARRKVQVRAAVQRFRERHGHRTYYERVS